MSRVQTFSSLAALNVANATLGVINTVVVAYYFGTGRDVEIYLAAVGLHTSVISMAQTGQVSEVLLPAFHVRRERHGREIAHAAYTAEANRFLAVLAAIAALAWMFAPQLAALRVPGFGAADIELAARMFRWILPVVLLQIAAELLRTLGNAERRFGAPETVSLAARSLSLVALVVLARHAGPWALVVALWCAGVAELVGLLWLLRRDGYRYRPLLSLPDGVVGANLFGKLAATLPYVAFTQTFLFSLDAALSHLSQGSFAVFRYATLIWSRTQGVFIRPLTTPFFTELSESAARRAGGSTDVAHGALARMLAVTAIVTAAVLAGAEPLLRGLWAGTRFPAEQVRTLAWLVGGLYVLLPLAGAATIWRKAAVSMQLVSQLYLSLSLVQLLSALLVWLLVPQLGLTGAFLVHAAHLVGFCLAPIGVLHASRVPFSLRYPFGRLWRWLLAAGLGTSAGLYAAPVATDILAAWCPPRVAAVGAGLLAAGVAMAITLAGSAALKVPESASLLGRVAHLLRRLGPGASLQ